MCINFTAFQYNIFIIEVMMVLRSDILEHIENYITSVYNTNKRKGRQLKKLLKIINERDNDFNVDTFHSRPIILQMFLSMIVNMAFPVLEQIKELFLIKITEAEINSNDVNSEFTENDYRNVCNMYKSIIDTIELLERAKTGLITSEIINCESECLCCRKRLIVHINITDTNMNSGVTTTTDRPEQ